MTEEKFAEFCDRLSASPAFMKQNLDTNAPFMHFLHGAIGLSTEAGELLDNAKRFLVYQQEPDKENALEEVGDCLHYLRYICSFFGFTFEDAMEANVAKLKKRYPQGFNTENAVNRDKEAEMRAIKESQ